VPEIRTFCGVHYSAKAGELNRLIAPPYDVLDEAQKSALAAKSAHNIVHVDVPWMPPKTVGPDSAYFAAATTLRSWLSGGILVRDARHALYPYTQSYEHAGKVFHRRGFIGLVRLSPFGAGKVVPHEKTYAGPIEDRLKLMHATGMQLSPIFGLFSDPRGQITRLLYSELGRPSLDATLDGVRNQLWAATDSQVNNQVVEAMSDHPVYIADGHHRYTTALAYQKEMQQKAGGELPATHPANWCLFVLVAMQDDGLLILPTHRLIGGLENFDVARFTTAIGKNFELTQVPVAPEHLAEYAKTIAEGPAHVIGLYDGKTRKAYSLRLINPNVLQPLEPGRSEAWRGLDVAILQRYLLDEVLGPTFAGGKELTRGYTADASTIARDVDGSKYQIALILRPTPLKALEDLGKVGDVIPQKSTYFFPKLATGMVMNELETRG
jgi:uncharacterized protein (DUF1015 family)